MKLKLSILFLFLFSAQVLSQTSLRGQLLNANGKPLPYTEIELVPIESDKIVVDARLIATSSTSGKFTFPNLPNGKYTLSINFDDKPTELSPYSTFFYPKTGKREEAQIIEVQNGIPLKPVTFQLPPALSKGKIKGKVLLPNGDSVEGAFIFVRDVYFDTNFLIARVQSDKNGDFAIQSFVGRKYQIGAILYEKQPKSPPFDFGKLLAATETEIFELTPKTDSLTLVLGKEDKDLDKLQDKYIGQIFQKEKSFLNFSR